MEKLLEILLFIVYILSCSSACSYTMLFVNTFISKKAFKFKTYLINFLILIPLIILNYIVLFYMRSLKLFLPISAFMMAMIIAKFVYKDNIQKTVLASVIYMIVTFFIDILSSIFLSMINMDLDYLNDNPIHYFCISIVIYLILAILTKVAFTISKLKSNNDMFYIIKYKYIMYQGLIIIISLIPSMFLLFYNNYDYTIPFIIVNTFQLVVVSLFSFFYMKKQIHFKDTELELENTKLHNKALATINENIRGFKHDMGNMVQSINGYLAVGNIDGVKSYCKNLLHGFNDINLLSILSPKVINEPAIYGVVVSKMLYARENNLTLSLDIACDVSKINFPSFELSRIFGILLDNAIEAASESEQRNLKLEMYYDENRKCDVIIIGNSIDDPTKIDIIKMFEKDYSTKENPSGFGLYEVLKFFKKNNKGDILPNIDYNTKFFTQTLTFDR